MASLNAALESSAACEAKEENPRSIQEAEKDKKVDELSDEEIEKLSNEKIDELSAEEMRLLLKQLRDKYLRKKYQAFKDEDKDLETKAKKPISEPQYTINQITGFMNTAYNRGCQLFSSKEHVLKYTTSCKQVKLFDVDSDIMSVVKKRLLSAKIQLIEEDLQIDNANVPCIVFCVFASRLRADVKNVIPDLKESPVILLILHPTIKELLTDKMSSHNSLLDSSIVVKCKGRIIHFAFSKDQGVYSCDQNNQSYEQLETILVELANAQPYLAE